MAQNRSSYESNVERKQREMFIAKWAWHRFNQLFPNEDTCIKELYKRFTSDNLSVCRNCGSTKTKRIDARTFLCLGCNKKSWFTAGTVLDGCKKLKEWFFAIWMSEQGIQVSGNQFSELTKVSSSTGSYMIKKIALLTHRVMGDTNTIKIPSVAFIDNFIKRSNHKPAKKHPKAEQKAVEETEVEETKVERKAKQQEEQEQSIDLVQLTPKTDTLELLSEKEARLYAALSTTPQDFDSLLAKVAFDVPSMSSTLTMLEIKELVTRVAGDLYVKAENPKISRSRTNKTIKSANPKTSRGPTIGSMIDSIKSTLQNISKKILTGIFQITGACTTCGGGRQTR